LLRGFRASAAAGITQERLIARSDSRQK